MSVLLYLASGKFHQHYEDLPFEKCYFVDRENFSHTFPKNINKINFIHGDALFAIDVLKARGTKIDTLVTVNEGIDEGGGSYAIFADFLMGYLSPLLKDEITLICNLNYYASSFRFALTKLDWGFAKIQQLQKGEPGYINPDLFKDNWKDLAAEKELLLPNNNHAKFAFSRKKFKDSKNGHVYSMKKIYKQTRLPVQNNEVKISLVFGSIWEDADELDMIGLNLMSFHDTKHQGPNFPGRVDDFFRKKKKVLDINGMSFTDILDYAHGNGLKRLGLTPWMKGDYNSVWQVLNTYSYKGIEEICFYHLNRGDYAQLYAHSTKI